MLTGTYGSIKSPGYPGKYPPGRDCVWRVITSPDLLITFTFGTLSLEHHDDCSKDYLEVDHCIYLFISFAALDLHYRVPAFSSCGELGLLLVVVHGLLIAVASLVKQGLWSTDSVVVAQRLVAQLLPGVWGLPGPGIEPVSHVGRQILIHRTTREVQQLDLDGIYHDMIRTQGTIINDALG